MGAVVGMTATRNDDDSVTVAWRWPRERPRRSTRRSGRAAAGCCDCLAAARYAGGDKVARRRSNAPSRGAACGNRQRGPHATARGPAPAGGGSFCFWRGASHAANAGTRIHADYAVSYLARPAPTETCWYVIGSDLAPYNDDGLGVLLPVTPDSQTFAASAPAPSATVAVEYALAVYTKALPTDSTRWPGTSADEVTVELCSPRLGPGSLTPPGLFDNNTPALRGRLRTIALGGQTGGGGAPGHGGDGGQRLREAGLDGDGDGISQARQRALREGRERELPGGGRRRQRLLRLERLRPHEPERLPRRRRRHLRPTRRYAALPVTRHSRSSGSVVGGGRGRGSPRRRRATCGRPSRPVAAAVTRVGDRSAGDPRTPSPSRPRGARPLVRARGAPGAGHLPRGAHAPGRRGDRPRPGRGEPPWQAGASVFPRRAVVRAGDSGSGRDRLWATARVRALRPVRWPGLTNDAPALER